MEAFSQTTAGPVSNGNSLNDVIEELFEKLERNDPIDIEAYLHENPQHAEQLGQLLPTMAALVELGRSDEGPNEQIGGEDPRGIPAATDRPTRPRSLGDFHIIRELGRGGMGVIYEAEQLSIGRRVALKVLPFAAMLAPKALQRFQNEVRAVGTLDHPNIVRIYSVGDERSVYFYAMQLVRGQSLAQVIEGLSREARRTTAPSSELPIPTAEADGPDSHWRPSTASGPKFSVPSSIVEPQSSIPTVPTSPHAPDTVAAALSTLRQTKPSDFFCTLVELGIQAAEALDHAHQLGIVHRDIKPSNLMVEVRMQNADYGNQSAPTNATRSALCGHHSTRFSSLHLLVTDFGLARLPTDAGLTMTGDLIGTLRYMSPEQSLAKRMTLDHRTDVYSLGITLYELLALRPAFDGADREELLRQIAFDEPIPLRRINSSIAVELQTIIHKAISKNPDDRYPTARDFADDLRRFLTDAPISARPATLTQRVVRWTHRHRSLVYSAATCLLIAVLAVAASVGWVLRDRTTRSTEAMRLATLTLDKVESLVREEKWDEALMAAREAEGVLILAHGNDNLRQTVRAYLADLNMVASLELATLHELGSGRDLIFDKQSCAQLYQRAFLEYGVDVPVLDKATAVRLLEHRSIVPQIVVALDYWAMLRREAADKEGVDWKHLSAIADALDSDPWRKRFRDLWTHGDSAALVQAAISARHDSLAPLTASWVAVCLINAKATDLAIDVLRAAQQKHPGDFWLNWDLAKALATAQPENINESLGFYRAALALRPKSGPVHNDIAARLSKAGKIDEALSFSREAVRLAPASAVERANLGYLLHDKGKHDEALRVLREAIDLDPSYPNSHHSLGCVLAETGLHEEALQEFKQTIRLNPDFAEAHYNSALVLLKMAKYDEAIESGRAAIRLNPDYAIAHNALGLALAQCGRLAESIPEFREAVRLLPDNLGYRENLHKALTQAGQHDGLEPLLRETIELLEKRTAIDPSSPDLRKQLGDTYTALSKLLTDSGRTSAETAEMDRQALAIHEDLVNQFPESIVYLDALAVAQWNYANEVWRTKEYSDAINRWEKAIELGERIRALDSKAPVTIGGDVPWLFVEFCLVTCPDRSQRDPDRALRNAQQLHAKIRGVRSHMALGMAWVGQHEWKLAVDELDQAPLKPDDVFEYVRLKFLSIAHHQLGNPNKQAECEIAARRWLEQYQEGLYQGFKENIEAADRLYVELVPGAVDAEPKSREESKT